MRDTFFTVAEIFGLAILIILAFILVSEFHNADVIQENALAEQSVQDVETAFTTYYDVGFLVIFVVSILSMMILGRLLPTHPVFAIPFVIVLLFIVIFTAQVSNWYYEFQSNPTIAPYIAQFTYIPFVMNNLPLLTFILTILIGVIVYTTPNQQTH